MLNKLLPSICCFIVGSLTLFGQEIEFSPLNYESENETERIIDNYIKTIVPVQNVNLLTISTDTIDDVIITFRGTYQLASIEVLSLVDSLHYVFNLKNNKRDGVGISYYSNGAIKWISNYEDNKLSQHSYYFYPSGAIKSRLIFDEIEIGDFSILNYYKNGNLKKSASRLKCEQCYKTVQYYESGAVFDSLNVNSGIENYIRYHKNGQIQITGVFHNYFWGLLGEWKHFYPNGKLERTFSYSDEIPNQREGDWKWYDENGKIIRWEQYQDGNLVRIVRDGEIEE